MTTNIHFKEGIKWPYGVMVSHQLDVLRVPRSILGEANLFIFLFLPSKSITCVLCSSLFLCLFATTERHAPQSSQHTGKHIHERAGVDWCFGLFFVVVTSVGIALVLFVFRFFRGVFELRVAVFSLCSFFSLVTSGVFWRVFEHRFFVFFFPFFFFHSNDF